MRRSFFILLFSLILLPKITFAAVINKSTTEFLKNDLRGYWTFDGSDLINGVVKDRSGNGNNGNLLNIASSTFYTNGMLGQGFRFDGIDDQISIPSSSSLKPASEISFSFWFYAKNMPSNNNTSLISKGGTGGYRVRSNGNSIQLLFNGSTVTACASTLTSGKWYHFVITVNASGGKCYYNAVLVSGGGSTPWTESSGTNSLILGRFGDSDGIMDDVRIYGHALSATEVLYLYNQGSGKLGSTAKKSLKSGLVGFWTFDGVDIVNGMVLDLSGNGNNGNTVSIASSTFYTVGKIGQGALFDGVNDSVNVGSAASLDDLETQGGGGMSVAFWIKPYSNASAKILSKGTNTNGNGNWGIAKNVATDPARLVFNKEGATDATANYNTTLTTGVWQHIVMTWNGSMTVSTGVVSYKNGALISQSSATDGATANSDAANSVHIGSANASSNFCDCAIDDVRIYNRVLSASEALLLYNQSVSKFSISKSYLSDSGLMGYWTFDGKDVVNGAAKDSSGQSIFGNLINISTSTFYIQGVLGQGFRFNGANTSIRLNSTFSTMASSPQKSIAAWVRSASSGATSVAAAINCTVSRICLSIGTDTNTYTVQYRTSADGSGNLDSNVSVNTTKWVHLAAVQNDTSIKIYVDGQQANSASNALGTPLVSSPRNARIGAWDNNTTIQDFFHGKIDDVRYYSRALSATEVMRLYNTGR